ncbi:Hypothetical protein D9617_14g076470 [Elsinoe fawcettii]|nr:Hypothetical protein D9617_14g076470 [Elsinoe fawcettii]
MPSIINNASDAAMEDVAMSDGPRGWVDPLPLSDYNLALTGSPDDVKVWLHRATIDRGCRVKGLCRVCKFGEVYEHVAATPVVKCLLHDYYVKNGLECRLGVDCPMGCGNNTRDNSQALHVINLNLSIKQCVDCPYCSLGLQAGAMEVLGKEFRGMCEGILVLLAERLQGEKEHYEESCEGCEVYGMIDNGDEGKDWRGRSRGRRRDKEWRRLRRVRGSMKGIRRGMKAIRS